MDSTSGHRKTVIRSDMFMRNAVKSLRKRNAVWEGSSKVVMPDMLNVPAKKILIYPRSVGI